MKTKITESNYESSLRRLGELEENILEVQTLLSDPNDNGSWCLGDPYEALSAMEIERDELQNMINQFAS